MFFPIIFLLFSLYTTSCQENQTDSSPSPMAFYKNIMTIDYKILVGAPCTPEDADDIQKIIDLTFAQVNETYNNWNPHSEISLLNKLTANIPVKISPQLEKLLQLIDEVFLLTEGRFDPTIAPLQKLWKQHLEKGHVPTKDEIEKTSPSIGWHNIHLKNGTFCKDHDDTSLDLGGIAKGLCVDLLVENLNKNGYNNIYVEWGGEIRTTGQHPQNRPWQIFISNLGDPNPENAIDILNISNHAIAASGDYWQYWIVSDEGEPPSNKDIYTHIVDPLSKKALKISATSIASVNVLSSNCALADALATATMLFPSKSEASVWAEFIMKKKPETTFWIISRQDIDNHSVDYKEKSL